MRTRSTTPTFGRTIRGVSCLGACVLAVAASQAGAAVTTVYKCFDSKLNVVYTDQPCRGEQLSIEGGSTDPVAIAELQREREALSRSAAQRIIDSRRSALDRDVAGGYGYAAPPPVVANYGNDGYYPGYAYGYSPNAVDRRQRQDHGRNDDRDRRDRRSVVPAPRGNLIKR